MAQYMKQFESFPTNYYTGGGDTNMMIRNQHLGTDFNDPPRFYTTQPDHVTQSRDRNIEQNLEQYERYNEFDQEGPDAEAHYITEHMIPVDYAIERQNVGPRMYYSVSPHAEGRDYKPVLIQPSYSPYSMQRNTPYNQRRERQDISEPARGSKYHLRGNYREDNSDIDEREAKLFTSMSQAELKNHVMQNANIDDYDQKDQQEKLIEQLLKKVGKLSNQYIKLAKAVKNSDYIRGYNTSVSQSQLRELEHIRDRFDNGSNINSSRESDVLKCVKEATEEIETVLTQNGNSLSINDIIKYVKEKFYEVYANNKEELESQNKTPLDDRGNIKNYTETGEFDDVRGKLDFQTAMDDLTKNYAWIKEKSIRSLESLDKKYQQIQADISELNTRLASYSVIDSVTQKRQKVFGQKTNPLKDAEKKVIFDVLEDVFGLVGYTNDSVNVTLEN